MNDGETYVIELTPSGRGAVAIVLVNGPSAVETVDRVFTPAGTNSLRELPVGRIAFGRWATPSGEEVVACCRSVDRVEVHCHGGVAAVRAIVERLVEAGCRRRDWQGWLQATEPDPIRAAALQPLASAPTARTAAILLDQYNGALSAATRTIWDAASAARWSEAAGTLDGILAMRSVGMHLVAPWRVVIAGPPNVGKSTLLNAIAGYQRAIVSPLAGTTRDVVACETAVDGWPVQLADTAGIREASDELEAAGIQLAGRAIADADLLIAVLDARDERELLPNRSMAAKLRIDVWNKADLLSTDATLAIRQRFAGDKIAPRLISAQTGEGVPSLVTEIGRMLVPKAPAAGAAVPFTADQLAALDRAGVAVCNCDPRSVHGALQALLSR
jgi:tRNA modification GTPase